jgi:hypothetical protein
VGYFVVHPGGQRYGPADLPTLNQWAAEGRLVPDTPLIDAASGAQLFARDVSGLFFPMTAGQSPGSSAPTMMPGPTVGTPLGGYRPPKQTNAPYTPNFIPQTPLSGSGGRGMPPAITAAYVASIIGIVVACCVPFLTVIAGIIAIGLGASANSLDPGRARGAIWLGIGTTVMGVLLSAAGVALQRALMGGGGGG